MTPALAPGKPSTLIYDKHVPTPDPRIYIPIRTKFFSKAITAVSFATSSKRRLPKKTNPGARRGGESIMLTPKPGGGPINANRKTSPPR